MAEAGKGKLKLLLFKRRKVKDEVKIKDKGNSLFINPVMFNLCWPGLG
ncbi:hypothetical protein PITCH_A640041 [uncultured Desulfobacterium sp.]|uniref:Uncharacterized protein n=1 Tax=uncultured Desulfobacterium sp. TaxID=201089 RepID=A0A445N1D0_9BACT|nr:hypothetical protein PITCH_A640041 [uncultured Desulfobacterium sp.]